MPSLVIPNTVQVSLIWQLNTEDHAVNVLHYLVPSGMDIGADEAQDWANRVQAAMTVGTNPLRPALANEYSFNRVVVRDLRAPNLAAIEAAQPFAGTSTADPLPAQTALCVTLRTNLAGRSFRGRCYLAGWAEAVSDAAGKPTATTAERAQNFIGHLQAFTVQGNLVVLGVASRARLETNAVTSYGVRDLVWDTQRRRSYPGI